MTRPLPTLLIAAAVVGCNLLPPMGTDADDLPDINRELTQIKDSRFDFCQAPALDAALTEIMDNADWNLVGCAAGWANEGEVVYLTAQGVRMEDDPDTFMGNDNIPYDIHTIQPIGSVSKPMTSVAILRLVEMGLVTLDDTVAQHLGSLVDHHPDFVRNATVRDLLSHRAGFNDGRVMVQLDADDDKSIVDLDVAFYDDMDWQSWGFDDDPTWGRRPAAAVIPLVIEDNPMNEPPAPAGGTYSNVGYLFVGAIIDAVVDQQSFTGFAGHPNEDAIERTYETWVWWLFSGEGTLESYSMWSPVLRHPWRIDDDAYDRLATGYYAPGVPIDREDRIDEYGWVAPSGGWMMTIGDLTRLGTVISERAILDQDQGGGGFQNPNATVWWNEAIQTHSDARGAGYGLGITKYNGPLTGHGGTIEGYVAGSFASNDVVVAFQCNTSPKTGPAPDEGTHIGLHSDIGRILLDAFDPARVGVTCPDPGGIPDLRVPYDAIDVLSNDHFPALYRELSAQSQREGVDATLRDLHDQMERDPSGARAIRALKDEDLELAAQCALVYLGDDEWDCPVELQDRVPGAL